MFFVNQQLDILPGIVTVDQYSGQDSGKARQAG
jgi:hypothetical protein